MTYLKKIHKNFGKNNNTKFREELLMGTRNLTCVIKDGDYKVAQYKVAQYGQWDGHPEGQGLIALNLLQNMELEKLKEQVSKVEFISSREIDKMIDGVAGSWAKIYPEFSRDTGAEILSIVYNSEKPTKLCNEINFVTDSLFCEWAYVVDLDKNTFEVYEGFNQQPLEQFERFYDIPSKDSGSNGFYQVKQVATFDLNNLPTKDHFLQTLKKS